MKNIINILLTVSVLCIFQLPFLNMKSFGKIEGAYAEAIPPGTYYGYVSTDRWGRGVFFSGSTHIFLTKKINEKLKKYYENPIKIKVSGIDQPSNPGGAIITEIQEISVIKGVNTGYVEGADDELSLSIILESKNVEKGKGIIALLKVLNNSNTNIIANSKSFTIVIVAINDKEPPSFKDPEDRSYWYFDGSYFNRSGIESEILKIACREIELPWTTRALIDKGSKMRTAYSKEGQILQDGVLIEPQGVFESKEVAGKELLPGEYEVFFCIPSGIGYIPGPMSKRLSFDVLETK